MNSITIFAVYEMTPGCANQHWLRFDEEDPDCPPATRFAAYVKHPNGFSLIVGTGITESDAREAGEATVARLAAIKAPRHGNCSY
jgi:hypothetical protein